MGQFSLKFEPNWFKIKRKFEEKKNQLIWSKFGPKLDECVTFSCKVGIGLCVDPISNSHGHVPTKTKLELPPGSVHHELPRVDQVSL